jgi:RNA polymerase sigma-70 factor (ECF subfamily)
MALHGDEADQWAELFSTYRRPLTGFFQARVSSPEDAQDLVQQTFTRLMQRAGNAPIRDMRRYVFQAAANVLRDHQRRQARRHQYQHDSYEDEWYGEILVEHSQESVYQAQELVERIAGALEALPERQQDIFMQCVLGRLGYDAVAELLGVSRSTVEHDLGKVMKHLDQTLSRTLDETP